jgi:AraC-like DNA-binding protein
LGATRGRGDGRDREQNDRGLPMAKRKHAKVAVRSSSLKGGVIVSRNPLRNLVRFWAVVVFFSHASMKETLRTPRAPSPIRAPRLQLTVKRRAESFVCRRCVDRGYHAPEEAFDAPYHFHPEVELLLMESSRGMRYVGDSVEPYAPGDLVLIGANVPHVFVRDTRPGVESAIASSIVVQFLPTFLGEPFLTSPEMREVQQLLVTANNGLHFGRQTVSWTAPQLRKLVTLQGARRLALLIDILARLVEAPARPLATSAFKQQVKQQDLLRISRVLAHVEARFHEEVTLAEVAKIVALSPTSFSRWFSAATGKPFIQFLTDVRLAHAYLALTETGKSVTEIAFDCGFNSVSHFIHRFHEVRKMSPREFRRRIAAGLLDAEVAGNVVPPAPRSADKLAS